MPFASDAKGRMRRAIRLALNRIGREGVDLIRYAVGVRVQRIGGRVIRSQRGEPPRRDSSKLWNSIQYKVEPEAEGIDDLEIFTTDPKAIWLEFGTGNMEARPFWVKCFKLIQRYAPAKFEQYVAENL